MKEKIFQRRSITAIIIASLSACSTSRPGTGNPQVTLVAPYEVLPAGTSPSGMEYKLEALGRIDPKHPVAPDSDTQTLSMFGREDLIAGSSDDYKSTGCRPLPSAMSAIDEIVHRARQTSIVVINESHKRSRHRGFAADVAQRLRPLGYDTLALETLSNPPADVPVQYLPRFITQPDLPYLEDNDGQYLSEASYGRLGRKAKALGYRLLRYEDNTHNEQTKPVSPAQQIALREEAEAVNLASVLKNRPTTKLLVYVGFSHAAEVQRADGSMWMAARLKYKTGIDPLTISQTACRGGSGTVHLSALPSDQPAGTFDLVVDHPRERFMRGRPAWRQEKGDQVVNIPRTLHPTKGWRVIEARPVGEAGESVPIDRVAIRPGENVALMLPPGRYSLRIIDVPEMGIDQKS
ncbi:hypothetical protein [Sphingomonas faeni]|uniref:hypothetical protein n=1 Tax=Sphingomonas faeni TaxID=185950 RepID=UPI00278B0E0F|nr:hypothetical protein [Sphingomonas faeni]MDQ0839248.1 hypothetical protein [Sphingomonas faeni]